MGRSGRSQKKSRRPEELGRSPKTKRRNRRGFRLTREGKIFLAVCLGVGLAAVNTGNNLLYLVLGLMLSLLLVSGTLSDLVLWRIGVSRHLPRQLFAGVPMAVEIELRNRKRRLPSYALEVEDRTEGEVDAVRRCFFLKVSGEATQRAAYPRTPPGRGVLHFEEVVVTSRHPFGLIEKRRYLECAQDAVVYPALVPVSLEAVVGAGAGRDEVVDAPGRGTDVRGLRDYREGDEARSIHWRRSAALDRFVVRERSREGRGRLALRLDQMRPADGGDPWEAGFERRISRAASLVRAALDAGFAVEVVVRGARSPLVSASAAPDPIFRFLAFLEAIEEPGAPAFPPVRSGTIEREVAA